MSPPHTAHYEQGSTSQHSCPLPSAAVAAVCFIHTWISKLSQMDLLDDVS